MSKVLYMRIDDDLHAQIKRIAGQAQVSINFAAEILLRRGLGDTWATEPNAIQRLEAALRKES